MALSGGFRVTPLDSYTFNILEISSSRHSLSIEPKNYVEILKNQSVFHRGKGELENAKGREHESTFTLKVAFLECFQTNISPQAEQSVILLTRERCRIVNIRSTADIIRTVSRLRSRMNLQVHFKFAFGVLFPSTSTW